MSQILAYSKLAYSSPFVNPAYNTLLTIKCKIIPEPQLTGLLDESNQLIAILTSIVKNSREA